MSLSRILNDEPSPAPSARSSYSHTPHSLPRELHPIESMRESLPPVVHHSRSEVYTDIPPLPPLPPRSFGYGNVSHGSASREPFSGPWTQDEQGPAQRGRITFRIERGAESHRSISPPEDPRELDQVTPGSAPGSKRRRTKGKEDSDYQPPGHKRVRALQTFFHYFHLPIGL